MFSGISQVFVLKSIRQTEVLLIEILACSEKMNLVSNNFEVNFVFITSVIIHVEQTKIDLSVIKISFLAPNFEKN